MLDLLILRAGLKESVDFGDGGVGFAIGGHEVGEEGMQALFGFGAATCGQLPGGYVAPEVEGAGIAGAVDALLVGKKGLAAIHR